MALLLPVRVVMAAFIMGPGPAPRSAEKPAPPAGPRPMADLPRPPDACPRPPVGFHGAVSEFKRRLIEATLTQAGGNRTRAARALGLQRTYLLRLMREFQVRVPPSPAPPRRSGGEQAALPPPNTLTPGRTRFEMGG